MSRSVVSPAASTERRRKKVVALRAKRKPSMLATAGLKRFAEVRRFFEHDSQLALALGWDEATVAEWRNRRVVRPQRAKVIGVFMLGSLCDETRPYLRTDTDVGRWAVTPMPHLRGSSPAQWLRGHGQPGLRQLVAGLVDWMPKTPERDLEPIDEQTAEAALRAGLESDDAVREFQRMLADIS